MPEQTRKEALLVTTVVAGVVTLLVNFLGPWILHWINPAGPKCSIVEANGVAIRTLPSDVRDQLNKAVTFRSWLVNAFPQNNFPAFPGMPQPKQCGGQPLLDTGSFDDQCGQRFTNWALQTIATNAANVLAVQSQSPPPPDKDGTLARFAEVQKYASLLADSIAKSKDAPGSKSGEFTLNIVLLNSGDGDDVLFPDASLSCNWCGSDSIPLAVDDRYLTLKAHSFLSITCSLNSGKIALDVLKRLRENINASPNLSIKTCLHLASHPGLCHAGEIH